MKYDDRSELFLMSEELDSAVGEVVVVPYPTSVIGLLLSIPSKTTKGEPEIVNAARESYATHLFYLQESNMYVPGKLQEDVLDTSNFGPGFDMPVHHTPELTNHFTNWFGPFRFVLLHLNLIRLKNET